MNSIPRLDQLIAQLQTQLRRQARRAAPSDDAAGQASSDALSFSRSTFTPPAKALSATERVQALRRAGVSNERQLVRCLLEGILGDEFGHQASNEIAFQDTVTMVLDALEDDPDAWKMCAALATGDAI